MLFVIHKSLVFELKKNEEIFWAATFNGLGTKNMIIPFLENQMGKETT